MIDAKDLRIGNWFIFDLTGMPKQVHSIHKPEGRSLYAIHTYTDYYSFWLENEISPIPLTPKILEAAGFHEDYCSRPAYKNMEICELSENQLWLCDKGCHNVYAQVEYLHQLQNLYYYLTGQELPVTLTPSLSHSN